MEWCHIKLLVKLDVKLKSTRKSELHLVEHAKNPQHIVLLY